MNVSNSTVQVSKQSTTSTRLPPRWLWLVRSLWLALTIISIGFYIAAIPVRINQLQTLCVEQPCPPNQLTPQGAQARDALGISATLGAIIIVVIDSIVPLAFVPSGLIIFWRRSDDWMAAFVSLTLVIFGITIMPPVHALATVYPLLEIPLVLLQGLSAGLAPLVFYLFPDGRFVPRWTRWTGLVWFIAILFIMPRLRFTSFGAVLFMIVIGSGLIAQVVRYRTVSGPSERQQTKWVSFGFVMFFMGAFLQTLPTVFFPQAISAYENPISTTADLIYRGIYQPIFGFSLFGVLPVTIAISTLRYRLWDIDPVINRSLVYGALTILLGLVFAGGFFALTALLELIVGSQQAGIALVVSTAVVVGLFTPTRRWLRQFVDQRLYHINVDYQKARVPMPSPVAGGRTLATETGIFEHLEPIGRGGMAEVYRAQHPTLDKLVAIKVLPPSLAKEADFRHRFEREARVVSTLKHPNIVQVYDSSEADGTYYMVLEYVEGHTLAEIIHSSGPLAPEQVTAILTQVASALDYAHREGLVHRDVKPSNVMIENSSQETGRAVLMDFGIARILGGNTYLTATGTVGTFDYIAPEQIQASANVDGRADIYALGVMAYQMLTGRLPFEAGHPAALLIAHLNQPAPDPRSVVPNIPEGTAETILRALAKQPEERFATAGEMVIAMGG